MCGRTGAWFWSLGRMARTIQRRASAATESARLISAAVLILTGKASANPIGVIARSDSDPRDKPEGRRGNPRDRRTFQEVAASLSLLAMTNGGNDNLKLVATPGVIMRTAAGQGRGGTF